MNDLRHHIARFGEPKHILDDKRQDEARKASTISALVGAFAEHDAELDYLLGPRGPIAAADPYYQERTGQMQLAQMMMHTIRLRKQCLGEAGTGIGKSRAYAVTGILHALRSKSPKKVLISTANLALQDQLVHKDLPFLQRALRDYNRDTYDRNFTFGLLKGKSNFACWAKVNAQNDLPFGLEAEQETISDWLDATRTGDVAELPFDLKQDDYYPLRLALTAEGEEDCPGRQKCEYGDSCFYYAARDRAEEADLVVVNHALVVIDALLGHVLLPEYDLLIIDEAHQFEEYVRSMTERTLSMGRVNRLLKKATKVVDMELMPIREAVGDFFHYADYTVKWKLGQGNTGQVDLVASDLCPELHAAADQVVAALKVLRGRLEAKSADGHAKAAALAFGIAFLESDFESLRKTDDCVLWAELPAVDKPPKLMLTMVNIAPFCRSMFWTARPAILTSATLATEYGEHAFRYQKDTLGLTMPFEVQIDSPFDYRRQALYYVPEIPESALERNSRESHKVASQRYAGHLAPIALSCLEATNGGCFLLFTSFSVLNETRAAMGRLPWPVMCQGDMAKNALIEWFKETPNAVLFATSSFWEGVDVPGDALRHVLIDKIPLPNPTQPVNKARLEKAGRRGFWEISVPRATMMLKQAVGRLIRRETDRGLIVLCDPRFRTKGYARTMLQALPGRPEVGVTTLDPASLGVVKTFLAAAPRPPRSPEEAWAAEALVTLAGLDPDQAGQRNDEGFNAFDTELGHSLASRVRIGLSSKQWSTAVQLCSKYHRQVGRPEVA